MAHLGGFRWLNFLRSERESKNGRDQRRYSFGGIVDRKNSEVVILLYYLGMLLFGRFLFCFVLGMFFFAMFFSLTGLKRKDDHESLSKNCCVTHLAYVFRYTPRERMTMRIFFIKKHPHSQKGRVKTSDPFEILKSWKPHLLRMVSGVLRR